MKFQCLLLHINMLQPGLLQVLTKHRSLQIIQVNLTSENPQPISAGTTVEFTFSVKWTPTSIPFTRRFERYLDYNFFEHQVPSSVFQHSSDSSLSMQA